MSDAGCMVVADNTLVHVLDSLGIMVRQCRLRLQIVASGIIVLFYFYRPGCGWFGLEAVSMGVWLGRLKETDSKFV